MTQPEGQTARDVFTEDEGVPDVAQDDSPTQERSEDPQFAPLPGERPTARADFGTTALEQSEGESLAVVGVKLDNLRDYQLSLSAPVPPAGTVNPAAAARGREVFRGAATCASCHTGPTLSDINSGKLHAPSETGLDPAYAARTSQKAYRTTPLRGLLQHPPYFHDGSARDLAAVVAHYERVLKLNLTASQKADLVEYLKSL